MQLCASLKSSPQISVACLANIHSLLSKVPKKDDRMIGLYSHWSTYALVE